MQRMRCSFRLAALALVCALAVGCSGKGKPTKSNFDKIKNDMSTKEVEELMGPAAQTVDLKAVKDALGGLGGLMGSVPGMDVDKQLIWFEGEIAYQVSIKDDKVTNKVSLKKDEITKDKKGTPSASDKEPPAGGKLTKANADKIKEGMSKAEVEAILGPGKAKADAGKGGVYIWQEDGKSITITFVDDKATVVLKAGF